MILFASLGLKKALSVVLEYPAMILLPGMTCWTFGGFDCQSRLKWSGGKQIGISMRLTFINFWIAYIGQVIYTYILIYFFDAIPTGTWHCIKDVSRGKKNQD